MTPENVKRVNEVVSEYTSEQKMFTAFEVSLEAQERAKKDGEDVERHRDMKDEIHIAIHTHLSNGDYTRTLMEVGAPDKAWVYHPTNTDANNYKPLDRTAHDAILVSHNVPPVVNPPMSVVTATPDGAHKVDARGRICFPVEHLKKIGIDKGVACVVTFNKGEVTVRKESLNGALITNDAILYSADKHGNVRVSPNTLRKAGLDGVELFKFNDNADEVTVVPFVSN